MARRAILTPPSLESLVQIGLGVDSDLEAVMQNTRPHPTQSRPEDFLDMLRRSRRGRLKLYIGFAAGVGKTFRMLEEAHALRKRGVDVVLGLVECHSRPDTAALVTGLEQVPLRRVEHRGVSIEEMDLRGVVARRPEVALVDEIAHTNAPGSHNLRRYQDVVELLDSGVSVLGALNVQHLESLNDLVARVTGIRVRETVPDSFLKEADQIVNLDLSVEDLIDRLRAGKIYAAERVDWALQHFFTEGNLATLRELALREVAESLDRATGRRTAGAAPAGAELGRIMVCMSSQPVEAGRLLRRGSRLAGRLNTDWYLVYVETPAEAPGLIDAEAQRHLLANIEKARELGAEVVRLRGEDPTSALLDFARYHRVGLAIVGRSREPWWRRLLQRTIVQRLMVEGPDLDLHVVSSSVEPES